MLDSIIGIVGRFAFGGKILGAVSAVNNAVSGKRTELVAAVEVLLFVLKKLGVIPPEALEAVNLAAVALLGALPVTLAEKIKRAQGLADKIVPGK